MKQMQKAGRIFSALFIFLAFIISSDVYAGWGKDPCKDVKCSGYGVCQKDSSDNAYCTCNDGYHAEGLYCLENGMSFQTQMDVANYDVCVQTGSCLYSYIPGLSLMHWNMDNLSDYEIVINVKNGTEWTAHYWDTLKECMESGICKSLTPTEVRFGFNHTGLAPDYYIAVEIYQKSTGDASYQHIQHFINSQTAPCPDGKYLLRDQFRCSWFEDSALEKVVAERLGKNPEDITKSDLASIITLTADRKDIMLLGGIELLKNLQTLSLSGNRITDTSLLIKIPLLRTLNAAGNPLVNPAQLFDALVLTDITLSPGRYTRATSHPWAVDIVQIFKCNRLEITGNSPDDYKLIPLCAPGTCSLINREPVCACPVDHYSVKKPLSCTPKKPAAIKEHIYYDMNGFSNTNQIVDKGKNKYDATASNVTSISSGGRKDGYMYFKITSNITTNQDQIPVTPAFGISMWLYLDKEVPSADINKPQIIGGHYSSAIDEPTHQSLNMPNIIVLRTKDGIQVMAPSSEIKTMTYAQLPTLGAGGSKVSQNVPVTLGWHHLAITYENGTMSLYLDNQKKWTESGYEIKDTTVNYHKKWVLGSRLSYVYKYNQVLGKYILMKNYDFPFEGGMDEFRVHNSLLTSEDVTDIYYDNKCETGYKRSSDGICRPVCGDGLVVLGEDCEGSTTKLCSDFDSRYFGTTTCTRCLWDKTDCSTYTVTATRPDPNYPSYHVADEATLVVQAIPVKSGVPVFMWRYSGVTEIGPWVPIFGLLGETDTAGKLLIQVDSLSSAAIGYYQDEVFAAGTTSSRKSSPAFAFSVVGNRTITCSNYKADHAHWLPPVTANGRLYQEWSDTYHEYRPPSAQACKWDCDANYVKKFNAVTGNDECVYQVCGDWQITGYEKCDDGNTRDGDGCSGTCLYEGIDRCGDIPVWYATGIKGYSSSYYGAHTEKMTEGCKADGGSIETCSLSPDMSRSYNCCIIPKCSYTYEGDPTRDRVFTEGGITVIVPKEAWPLGKQTLTIRKVTLQSERMPHYVRNVTDYKYGPNNPKYSYQVLIDNDPTVRFAAPVTIKISYDEKSVLDMGTENNIGIATYLYTEERWKLVDKTSQDKAANTVTITTDSPGQYYSGSRNVETEAPHSSGLNINPKNMDITKIDPLAGIVEIAPPQPNASGGAAASYSFKVPSDNNFAPALNLAYSSDNQRAGNAGLGWNLTLSAITIKIKNKGIPRYDGTEEYLLDGKELIHIATSSTGKTYRLKREDGSFIKAVKESETGNFITSLPDGTVAVYAAAYESENYVWKIKKITNPAGQTITYLYDEKAYWPKEKSPTNSNEFKDVLVNIYPNQIQYGSQGDNYKIYLDWKNKTAKQVDFSYGRLYASMKILSRVKIDYSGTRLSTYVLTHTTGAYGSEELLASIHEYKGDETSGTLLNNHVFSYNGMDKKYDGTLIPVDEQYFSKTDTTSFITEDTTPLIYTRRLGEYAAITTVDFVDINGDRLPDRVIRHPFDNPGASSFSTVQINTGIGFLPPVTVDKGVILGITNGEDEKWHMLHDMTGDQIPEHVSREPEFTSGQGLLSSYQDNKNGITSFFDPTEIACDPEVSGKCEVVKLQGSYVMNKNVRLIDVNGDGAADIIFNDGSKYKDEDKPFIKDKNYFKVWLNNGAGTGIYKPVYLLPSYKDYGSINVSYTAGLTYSWTENIHFPSRYDIIHTSADFMDMNGDGIPDWVGMAGKNKFHVGFSRISKHSDNKDSFVFFKDYDERFDTWDAGLWTEAEDLGNDFCRGENNTESNLRCVHRDIVSGGQIDNMEIDFFDINGDGLPDRVAKHRNSNHFLVQLNTGSGFTSTQRWFVAPLPWTGNDDSDLHDSRVYTGASQGSYTEEQYSMMLDINGDGCPDRISRGNPGQLDSHNKLYVQYNNTCNKNILMGITNQITGTKVDITYDRQRLIDRPNTEESYAVEKDNYMTRLVLKTIHVTNPNTKPAFDRKTTVTYKDGIWDYSKREFRGFGSYTATTLYTDSENATVRGEEHLPSLQSVSGPSSHQKQEQCHVIVMAQPVQSFREQTDARLTITGLFLLSAIR